MTNNDGPEIIILGIDALEYKFVEEWRLLNIMQEKYCKLDLSDYRVIVTPPIWGSMITGKIDEEIIDIWVKHAEIMGGGVKVEQKRWVQIIGKIIPNKLGFFLWDHFYSKKIGGDPFETTANYVNNKKLPTIFDLFNNTWTNGLPGYGKNVSGGEKKKLTEKAISGDKEPFRKYILNQYSRDKSQLLEKLEKKENDLIFWYTPMLDNLGHMDIGKPLTHMMKHYLEINSLIGKVKNICPKSKLYIVSDHGMEKMDPKNTSWGMHSDHAFFSSNTGETIEKPFQLYNLVKNQSNEE